MNSSYRRSKEQLPRSNYLAYRARELAIFVNLLAAQKGRAHDAI